MSPLHGSGQRLKADVISAAVPAKGNELKVDILRKLSPFFQHLISSLHTAEGGACILKGVVDITVLPCRIGIHKGGDLQTARSVADDGMIFLTQGAENGPDSNRGTTAGTHPVPGSQSLRFLHHGF